MDERPVWRQFFDAWEKEFGPRLEEYVQTDEFAEQMTAFQQMNRRTAEMNEEASRQVLRSWNLPTASDLEKLSQQVADIDRRLRALSQRVDEAAPAPGPRKRQGSKTPAGVKAAAESREAAANRTDAASGGGATVETGEPPSADTAGSAEGATGKATARRPKSAKATPAKASKSARSSASPQKATSHSRDRRRGNEGDAGNNPTGEA